MKLTIIFQRDSKIKKKKIYLQNRMFYAPTKLKINPILFEQFDVEINVTLPKHFQAYFSSKFITDKIEQVCSHE